MAEMILDHDDLREKVHALKAEGKRVVFTNGCFNLLHVGHVRYLRGAKELGDVLVVALNGDDSVRGLKGRDYPVLPEEDRAEVIAALGCVDVVTVFRQPDVSGLLLDLKPHVHAKGADYTVETIPERETVLSYGGELAVTGGPKNHSTSRIIARIADWARRNERSDRASSGEPE